MIGLIFAGQGSQVPKLGLDFYERYDHVKDLFLMAEEVTGLPLREVAFAEDDARLHETLYAQILLFLYDVFVVDLLQENGLEYHVTFGLSLGEYGALYASGVFDKESGLKLILHRAKYMSEACDKDQAMAAILGLDEDLLMPLLDHKEVFLANYNTPKQLVISGSKKRVLEVMEKAQEIGAKRAVLLATSGAFHTPYMKEAMERFALYVKDVNLEEPKKHLLLNTTGNLYQGDLKKHMEMQIVSSVHFYQSVEKAMELGVDTFVEVAPKSVLKSMVKKVNRKINVLTISSVDELEQVVGLL